MGKQINFYMDDEIHIKIYTYVKRKRLYIYVR